MKLVIGSKNYSSWSLRPWLVLRHAAVPFEEECIRFTDPDFKARVMRVSGAGKVPVLVDGDLVVWDSLAIVEYLAEQFPDRCGWPADPGARARARSICAEVHSGFMALRQAMPFNCSARFPTILLTVEVQKEVDRVVDLWKGAAPFACGDFSIVDAYFAPFTRRFVTYGVDLPPHARGYVETIEAIPAMQEWIAAAAAEHEFFARGEPYRKGP
jgi:glutathione S-transferase